MTADFACLPVAVQRIVVELSSGPTDLIGVQQASISAAFAHGVIETCDRSSGGHTVYRLRKAAAS